MKKTKTKPKAAPTSQPQIVVLAENIARSERGLVDTGERIVRTQVKLNELYAEERALKHSLVNFHRDMEKFTNRSR